MSTANIPGAVPVSESAGVSLRKIRRSDLPFVKKVFGCLDPELQVPCLDAWITRIDPDVNLWIIMVGKTKVGMVGYLKTPRTYLIVLPEYRNQGIGSAALRKCQINAKIQGKQSLTVVVKGHYDFFYKRGFRDDPRPRSWAMKERERRAGLTLMRWGRMPRRNQGINLEPGPGRGHRKWHFPTPRGMGRR